MWKGQNETGKLRPDQVKFANLLLKQPVIYGVARSSQQAVDIIERGGMTDKERIELNETYGIDLPF